MNDRDRERASVREGVASLWAFARWFRTTPLWTVLSRQRWWWLAVFLLSLPGFAVAGYTASTFSSAIDQAIIGTAGHHRPLAPYVSSLVRLAVLTFVLTGGVALLVARIAWQVDYELRVLL